MTSSKASNDEGSARRALTFILIAAGVLVILAALASTGLFETQSPTEDRSALAAAPDTTPAKSTSNISEHYPDKIVWNGDWLEPNKVMQMYRLPGEFEVVDSTLYSVVYRLKLKPHVAEIWTKSLSRDVFERIVLNLNHITKQWEIWQGGLSGDLLDIVDSTHLDEFHVIESSPDQVIVSLKMIVWRNGKPRPETISRSMIARDVYAAFLHDAFANFK